MKHIFLSLALVACLAINLPQDTIPENYIIVAIMGQSNASGYSICPDVLPVLPSGVYSFGNDYVLRHAAEPLDIGTNQVDMVSYDSISRCGPGAALGWRLNKYLQKNIILVPCAKGGSFSIQWLPSTNRDTLYGSCLNRIRAVNPDGSHRVLIFFFQGESDARQLDSAKTWGNKFMAIAAGLKSDLNNPPIVFVQLSQDPNIEMYPYFDEVKAVQASINLPNVVMVKSDDLPLDSTGHLSYESSKVVGIRAADALILLAKQSRQRSPWLP